MRSFQAAWLGLKLGVVLACGTYALLRWRFPVFFGERNEDAFGFVAAVAAVPAALGFVLGLVTRRGAAIGVAATAAAIAAALALLFLPTPSPAGVIGIAIGSALVAALIAARPALEKRRATVACAALAVLLAVAAALAPRPARAELGDRPRILFYGLDAGTWTILNELFARDELPNLRRLRDDGTSGVLLSELESASPRVWTTIATGKLPAKHGILDFHASQNTDLKTRRLWEILQARGWSVGMFQWLMTWPPDPLDDFIVPAWMARGPETHPRELSFIKELELSFQTGEFEQWLSGGQTLTALTHLRDWGRGYLDHGLRLRTVLRVAEQALAARGDHWELQYAAKRTIQLLLNGDVYLELYRRHQPDVSCFIAYGTDNLAHKFWQYHFPDDFGIPHEKAAPFRNLLTDYYKECDRLLGEILPLLSPQTTVLALSDHGFTSSGVGGDSHQREHRPKMSRIANLLGLTEQDVKASSVATSGYFRPQGPEERIAETYRKILGFLEGCTGGAAGAKVFRVRVQNEGEIAIDMNADFERDTPIETPLGAMRYGDLADIEDRTGNHAVEGILLARGPGIRRGARIEGARLQDVTPTLLFQHGLPVGADMDGRVLLEMFETSFLDEHVVERIASWDEEVTITRDSSISGDESAWRRYASQIGYVEGGEAPGSSATERATQPETDPDAKRDGSSPAPTPQEDGMPAVVPNEESAASEGSRSRR